MAKNEAKPMAKNNPLYIRALCFDLEKTLPTPMPSSSIVFYTRQLWTYNLGIHDLGTNEASMYMWHEGEGRRGSQEVGSCLLQHAQALPSSIENLIAFSDNGGSQNKNHNIIKFWDAHYKYNQYRRNRSQISDFWSFLYGVRSGFWSTRKI